MAYDLYSPFNAQKHKETYKYYLEAIVLEDGSVQYSVPSHQEKAIEIACQKLNVTRQQLSDMCPKKWYANFLEWLLMQSNSVALWYDFCVAPKASKKQIAKIAELKELGIYAGPIPKGEENVMDIDH